MPCYPCGGCNKCGLFDKKSFLACKECGTVIPVGASACPACGCTKFDHKKVDRTAGTANGF